MGFIDSRSSLFDTIRSERKTNCLLTNQYNFFTGFFPFAFENVCNVSVVFGQGKQPIQEVVD